nr:MAG TPA: hypothetical protein [Caudoviricetes sp.]
MFCFDKGFLWPRGLRIQDPINRGISTALVGSFRTSRPPVSGNFENNQRKPS